MTGESDPRENIGKPYKWGMLRLVSVSIVYEVVRIKKLSDNYC